MKIHNRDIDRVLILDDESLVRDSYVYPVEDLDIEPFKVDGPIDSPRSIIDTVSTLSDVILCDLQLKQHRYSQYNGDFLMEAFYKANIPGVLCTSYTDVQISRQRLRYIPSLVKTTEFGPEVFVKAWERCIKELNGSFHPTRKPWRALVRIEEVVEEQHYLYAIVPAWDVRSKIKIYLEDVPPEIRPLLMEDKRLHAWVNIGAENHEHLFFESWETE